MTATRIDIRVQESPFDPSAEQDSLRRGRPSVGALVAFVGLMRDINEDQRIEAMTLEHYPGMTERALQQIASDAARRWDLDAVRVIHRVGRLLPEEPIVLVAVTSRHRGDAFRACEFLIDFLKTRAPFWKKEEDDTHGGRWVDARASDDNAAARWDTGTTT
jgi:molybdopterin synthase catalytic subunit